MRRLFLILALAAAAFGAERPHVFFTDLKEAPNTGGEHGKGPYVRAFGKFGGIATAVKINGATAALKSACQLCSKDGTLDEVAFEPDSGATTGAVEVVVGGVTSTGGPTLTIRSGNTYFVKSTGSDANVGSFASPWLTVQHARNTIVPGDVVIDIDVSLTTRDNTSSGFTCAALVIGSGAGGAGTSGNNKALTVYPGNTVTIGDTDGGGATGTGTCVSNSDAQTFNSIQRTGGVTSVVVPSLQGMYGVHVGGWLRIFGSTNYNRTLQVATITDKQHFTLTDPGGDLALETSGSIALSYNFNDGIQFKDAESFWTIANFTVRAPIDGIQTSDTGGGMRYVNNDVSCPWGDALAACFDGGTRGMKFLGMYVHDAGMHQAASGGVESGKFYHGMYMSNGGNHDVEIGWSTFRNIYGCRGVQFFAGSGTADYAIDIHDSNFDTTRCDAINLATVDPSQGAVRVWNNDIRDAGAGPDPFSEGSNYAGVYLNSQSINTGPAPSGTVQIFNNTLRRCGAQHTSAGPDQGCINNANLYAAVTANAQNNIFYTNSGQPYVNGAGVITGTFNLCYGNGGACPASWNGASWTSSLNVDPGFIGSTNFHLAASAPAGVIASGNSTAATQDHDGITRGTAIGAYEPARAAGTIGPGSFGGSVK